MAVALIEVHGIPVCVLSRSCRKKKVFSFLFMPPMAQAAVANDLRPFSARMQRPHGFACASGPPSRPGSAATPRAPLSPHRPSSARRRTTESPRADSLAVPAAAQSLLPESNTQPLAVRAHSCQTWRADAKRLPGVPASLSPVALRQRALRELLRTSAWSPAQLMIIGFSSAEIREAGVARVAGEAPAGESVNIATHSRAATHLVSGAFHKVKAESRANVGAAPMTPRRMQPLLARQLAAMERENSQMRREKTELLRVIPALRCLEAVHEGTEREIAELQAALASLRALQGEDVEPRRDWEAEDIPVYWM